MTKKTITIKEASLTFGLSTSWLYKRSAERSIPILKVGGKVLIDIDEFSRWLRSHAVGAGKGVKGR